jgi:hypothetical protein
MNEDMALGIGWAMMAGAVWSLIGATSSSLLLSMFVLSFFAAIC